MPGQATPRSRVAAAAIEHASPNAAVAPPPSTPPLFSIQDATTTEGGTLGYSITLDRPSDTDITTSYVFANGTGNPATNGTDYIGQAGTIVIPAGRTQVTLSVNTLADDLVEGDETVGVQLSNPTGVQVVSNYANGVIRDGVVAPTPPPPPPAEPPKVFIEDAMVAEGATLSFGVLLDKPSDTDITMRYDFASGGGAPATNGVDFYDQGADFGGNQGQIVIPAGRTQVVLYMPALIDSEVEGTENFGVNLSSLTGATFGDNFAVGTIVDGTAPPPPPSPPSSASEFGVYPYFTDASGTRSVIGAEEGGIIYFYIQKLDYSTVSNPITEDARFVVLNVGGSASSDDYLGSFPREVTIPKGGAGILQEIHTVDDGLVEGNETLSIQVRKLNDDGSYGALVWDPQLNQPLPGLIGDTLTFPILDNDSALMV